MKTMYYIIVAAIIVSVITLFCRCCAKKNQSITIVKDQTSEVIHNQVLNLIDSIKGNLVKNIEVNSNKPHMVEIKCRTSNIEYLGNKFDYISSFDMTKDSTRSNLSGLANNDFISTFSLYGPKESTANFDLTFKISDNKCIVTMKNIKYTTRYLSRHLPMAGAPKSEVSRDKKRLENKVTPILTDSILNSIRAQL